MIALSPSARVYLASGITDMRNYAECIDLGHQDGGGLQIPKGVGDVSVAEIGGERDEMGRAMAFGVVATLLKRANREGMNSETVNRKLGKSATTGDGSITHDAHAAIF
jgi:hypothetical protein